MAVVLYMGDYLVTVSAGVRSGTIRYLPRACNLTVDAWALPSRLHPITSGPLAGQRVDIWD